MKIERAFIDDIVVGKRHRALDETRVNALAESMALIGLQQPLTLFVQVNADGEEVTHLVAGLHRLDAARRLGWEKVDAIFVEMSAVDRELWEIAENLHRVDLTKDQRDQHIRRYAELLEAREAEKLQSPQPAVIESNRADGRGHRPKGIARKIADKTGLSDDTVRRALKQPDPEADRRREEDKAAKKRQHEHDASMCSQAADEPEPASVGKLACTDDPHLAARSHARSEPESVVDAEDTIWAAKEVRRLYNEYRESDPDLTPNGYMMEMMVGGGRFELTSILCALMGLPRDPWPGLTGADLGRMTKGRTREASRRGIRVDTGGEFELDAYWKLRCSVHREWLEQRG